MQVTIAIVALAVFFFLGQSVVRAGVFFVVMQISAVIGAVWAARLTSFLVKRQNALPLERMR